MYYKLNGCRAKQIIDAYQLGYWGGTKNGRGLTIDSYNFIRYNGNVCGQIISDYETSNREFIVITMQEYILPFRLAKQLAIYGYEAGLSPVFVPGVDFGLGTPYEPNRTTKEHLKILSKIAKLSNCDIKEAAMIGCADGYGRLTYRLAVAYAFTIKRDYSYEDGTYDDVRYDDAINILLDYNNLCDVEPYNCNTIICTHAPNYDNLSKSISADIKSIAYVEYKTDTHCDEYYELIDKLDANKVLTSESKPIKFYKV